MVGFYGLIQFYYPFMLANKMTLAGKSRWKDHQVIGSRPCSEFIGPDLMNFTLTMNFNPDTTNILIAATLLEGYMKSGSQFPLLLGNRLLSNWSSNFRIDQISEVYDCVSLSGKIVSGSIEVKFNEVANSPNSIAQQAKRMFNYFTGGKS
jgi:hypothetical protein